MTNYEYSDVFATAILHNVLEQLDHALAHVNGIEYEQIKQAVDILQPVYRACRDRAIGSIDS